MTLNIQNLEKHNIVSFIIFAIIFYLVTIPEGHILTALLIALCGSSPIFLINSVWLGRQNKFFTFDQSLEKMVVERQNNFVFRVTCTLGLFLIIFLALSCLSKTRYTNIADIGIFFVTLMLSSMALILFGLFNLLFTRLLTKLIRRQYFFVSKVKVSEYWLRHINDVKIQCSSTVGSYGIVSERCKIIAVLCQMSCG